MLLAFWSPKGGSGTSVVATAAALALARRAETRLADLGGDLPAVLGLASDPSPGLSEWLELGAEAPTEALAHLAVDVAPSLRLLPRGDAATTVLAPVASAEAGAALAVALGDGPPTVVDASTASTPATRALVEVADHSVVVLRRCYLGLRRGAAGSTTARASGVVVVEESGRALAPQEISDVLDLRVLAQVPWRSAIANAVDAGVLVGRTPDALARPVESLLGALGLVRNRAA